MKILLSLLLITLLSLTFTPVKSINGFDISSANGKINCFKCIKEEGFDIMMIEILSSWKQFNNDIVYNIKQAQANGVRSQVYVFPDTSKTPQQLMHWLLGYLKTHHVQYDFLWLDVENQKLWFPDCQKNINYLQGMIDVAKLYMPESKIGIYVQNYYWEPMMCGTEQFNQYKLWWPRWNNEKNFDNFKSFGGWDKPVMKQICANKPICCLPDTDYDWTPNEFWNDQQDI